MEFGNEIDERLNRLVVSFDRQVRQDDPVHPRLELLEEVVGRRERQLPRLGQDADLNVQAVRLARLAAEDVGSMGIALGACTLPAVW